MSTLDLSNSLHNWTSETSNARYRWVEHIVEAHRTTLSFRCALLTMRVDIFMAHRHWGPIKKLTYLTINRWRNMRRKHQHRRLSIHLVKGRQFAIAHTQLEERLSIDCLFDAYCRPFFRNVLFSRSISHTNLITGEQHLFALTDLFRLSNRHRKVGQIELLDLRSLENAISQKLRDFGRGLPTLLAAG